MNATHLLTSNPLRRRFGLATLALAAAPLLVSCGGGGGSSGDPTPLATLTSATAGVARYGQPVLLTLMGTNLDQSLTITSAGCTGVARSTTAPNISTATTAYYTCRVSALGAQQFTVVRGTDNINLGSAAYTVAVPQVTMTVSNGAAVNGTFVITLSPVQAPITVNNFLNYVNAGFYNGSIFHRTTTVATTGVDVVQAGGYDAPVAANSSPAHKPTSAPIVLEDNAGLSNVNLTVAMARTTAPDTATSEFFINTINNTNLDRTASARGYAVFGSVSAGAPVVAAIRAAPCVVAIVSGCLPIPNVVISSAAQTQ